MSFLIFLLLFFQSSYCRLFCNNFYSIKSGDSCWKISRDFGVTVDNLKKWNENLNCDNLWVANKICVGTSENQPKCVKKYTAKSGDYCYKIMIDNNLTSAELFVYNPHLDCDTLMSGQELCLEIEKPFTKPRIYSLPMIEKDLDKCGEFVIVKESDTCWSISNEYGLNVTKLEHEYKCDVLFPGDTICISDNQTCQFRYQIKDKTDTCSKISQIFKTTHFEIEEYNSDINCTSESLEIGRRICVWPIEERELANITCVEYQSRDGNSLFELARHNSISIDELIFLNPNFDQQDNICVKSNSTVKCAGFEFIQPNDTCDIIIQRNQMSMKLLMTLNPTLRCDSLNITKEVCIGTGYFGANECIETIRINPDNDRCHKISNSSSISIERLELLNKGINCSDSAKLKWSSLVCISSLGMKTETAQQTIVQKLGAIDTNLNKIYQEYLKNPNEMTSQIMNQQIMESIGNTIVYKKLKELYKTDQNIQIILDNQSPMKRDVYCNQIRKSTFSDKIKSCFCSSDELLIYCQALAQNEYLSTINDPTNNNVSFSRNKRCQITWPGSGSNIFEKVGSGASGCFGADCTIPLVVIEVSFEGSMCVPLVKYSSDTLTTCLQDSNDCRSSKDVGENYLKELSSVSTTLSASVCVIGSKLLRALKIVSGICWSAVEFEYAPFIGLVSVSTEISLAVVTFKYGVKIKATDLPFSEMCDMGAFECEDYCKMRADDWENGKAYTQFEVRMFQFFGWSGVSLYDEKFNDPRILGCQAGSEAAIILRNERNCANEKENEIQRRCWSGDDNIPWGKMEDRNGFSFKPHMRTLFVCEFLDSNGQKIGFDVYGGKSKQTGKKTFYYVVKNDGIYFGRNSGEENDLKGAWEKPCSDKNEEETEKIAIEPTGTSSVAAASCGKRIVGYYTGWGDREITEDQLRKLTHVIFAFVELEGNQNLKFGKVAVDDTSDKSDSRAEARFLDMTRKARKVESGVNVLFAIGGWDNSQYFSSSCSNSESRSRLVDNIIKFIDMYNIDRIDIDWEYPNIDGADKDNHVQLMREIREKLDDLQEKKGRKQKYLITMATAAGEWNLRKGYDFDNLLKYVDFLNIMTYDYYGAWESKWGAYTGPPSPLYYGTIDGFSGKLNTDFTMKYYSCKTKKSKQLSMGIPFYGRYWDNVLDSIDGKDGMWRTAEEKNGKFEGGFVGWRNLERQGWNKGASIWHDKTKTPYILNGGARKFLGYENEQSIQEKINYAIDKNIGGLMVWALDLDDDSDTLLSLVSSADLCSASSNQNPYNCVPIDDVRWWTPENSDETKQGQCGKSAPLINGYYPVCDPDDPGYACCGSAGYCGSGEKYCDCETCLNYRKDPQLILKEPIKPTRDIEWFTSEDGIGKQGRCGKEAPLLSNGKIAICNPDDDSKYCCSNGGYCGIGKEYCECDGCVNYRK
ncbi:unnamed protein product [Caenorhabditis angaria]|uniref:Chitinase n=1 Tax=Caenorhabditis angaria TaxID=860376 RepID=A0A9P1IIS7_9PELO|nr:unnamed protein product [Caenorhabditis angaria]